MGSMPTLTAESAFDLDAGVLCLDFTNTLEDRVEEQPRELLHDYRDLLMFSRLAGTLDEEQAQRFAAVAEQRPDDAAVTLRDAITLREAIFGVFSAVAHERQPDPSDMATLNAAIARGMSHGKIMPSGEEFVWTWDDDPHALDRPLWPIAHSAVDLLLDGDLRRIRECAADDCGWLFYDTSRNLSRRWCSMQSCGNRAKVQQFRARRRGERS